MVSREKPRRHQTCNSSGAQQTQTIVEESIQEQTATTTTTTTTTAITAPPQQLVLHLRPHQQQQHESIPSALTLPSTQPNNERRVTFTPETIDNEHLGRLKSNCCCIYVPPRKWDDPSTWTPDEAETEHCRGHTLPPPPSPDSKKKKKMPEDDDSNNGHGPGCC